MNLVRRLWNDEVGFVVSAELVLVGTMLVIGCVVGLTSVRNQVVQELGDLAIAIGNINQSYEYSGVVGHSSATSGSIFQDKVDFCDLGGIDPMGGGASGIEVFDAPSKENDMSKPDPDSDGV